MKGTITVENTTTAVADANSVNKNVIFESCVSFIDCISKISNVQTDNDEDIDVVMPILNLIEFNDNYSKTFGILWQYCRDKPAVNAANGDFVEFNTANTTNSSFKVNDNMTSKTGNDDDTKSVETMTLLKYLSYFLKTLEISLTNCETNFLLTWSAKCVIVSITVAKQGATFSITVTTLYVPAITLST